eukprot:6404059-Prymnesium_polylepis.1
MLPSIFLNLMLQFFSAAIYCGIEGIDFELYHERFTKGYNATEGAYISPFECYGLALYHCLVTASTVGYGDIPIKDTARVRTWASLHILLSVSLLGESISTFDVLRAERAKELMRLEALNRKLDHALLENLNMRAAALRPDVHRDAEGLTELEFVIGMCMELNMIDMDQIKPFIEQFRKLDVDGNGRLAYQDLRVAVIDSELDKGDLLVQLTELARRKAINEQSSKQRRLAMEVPRRGSSA